MERPISQARDMYIAQRAQAFVGNGVSVPDPVHGALGLTFRATILQFYSFRV